MVNMNIEQNNSAKQHDGKSAKNNQTSDNGINIELIGENNQKHQNNKRMQYLPRIHPIPANQTLLIPIIVLYKLIQPFKRGFYCDDDSIRYPFLDSTIPSNLLFTYSILIPTITVSNFKKFQKIYLTKFFSQTRSVLMNFSSIVN
ncbi:phosphatidate phosphatase-like protein [Euroglyphus maynei]|uniref:Phosphatidate phosphatase-like protein n=1 Tax=Euroglyphus maynei TaxID=6958 RepID=A0A1Y3AXZ9_EURMA|nr:phosphatidate phosphatase-like protein [Euroglyphus maynei]